MVWTKADLWVNYSWKETYLCCHNLEVLLNSYTKAHCKSLISPLQETYLLDDWHFNCFKSKLEVWFVKIMLSFLIFFFKKSKTNIKLCTQGWSCKCSHSPAIRTARFKPFQSAQPKVQNSTLSHTALKTLQVFTCEQLYCPAAGTKRYSCSGTCYCKPANRGNRI